ncbi:MAG: ABC transporter substrate-binding protein [Candidatus Brocadiia bacterium]
MRRHLAGIGVALLAAGLMAGCAKPEEEEQEQARERQGPIVVGFSQIGAESAWRTAETRSIKAEAEKRGVELKFAGGQQKQENQIQAIRSFIAQKVDAIILAPIVKTGWDPVLREARDAGIPVVLVDRGIEVSQPGLYEVLIASDFVEEGRMAGRWLAEHTEGTAKIVEITGTPGSDPAIDRHKGFQEIIDEHPQMEIIASQTANFRRAEGKDVMANIVNAKGEDIEAVYAHNDDMALGAIQALEDGGMKPGDRVLVVSIDGIKDALQAIIDGQLNCSVECNPLLGPKAFDAVEHALFRRITIQDRLFDKSNAADYIDQRKY